MTYPCCAAFPDCPCATAASFCEHGRHLTAGCAECQAELVVLRAQNAYLTDNLKHTTERLERLQGSVKWAVDNQHLDTADRVKARLLEFIEGSKRKAPTLGAWHTYLGRGNTFCLELTSHPDAEGRNWLSFDWHGGALYGWGIKNPDYAQELKETITGMAARLAGMTVEQIKAIIDARTDEIDGPDDQENRWDVEDRENG